MDKSREFLINDIKLKENDTIVVGVSAGPDSMTLLYLLNELRKDINFKIVVAHVNHNVRVESKEEAEFLEHYCKDHNDVFEMMKITKYGDDNFENEARVIRYKYYQNLIDKYHANYLMTGHHGDDLIETILMRIVRGSTLKGYAGFSSVIDMDSYRIVRPLVFYDKETIREFANRKNIPYRTDKSNANEKYTRNRYRKNVLPFLKGEDKNVHEKFLKFSKILLEYNNYIDIVVNELFEKVYINDKIVIPDFIKLDNLIQRRIIGNLLANIYQDDILQIDDRHVDLILNLIYCKKSNGKYNLPNDYLVIKSYNFVYIKKVIDDINGYDIELNDEVFLPNGMKIVKLDECSENGNDIMRLNSKDVVLPLRVRTRKIGDKFYGKNMNGVQKVSQLFINSKIPLEKRDLWPIVVDSNDTIVWIPCLKKTKYNCLKDSGCDIIFKCY